MLVLVPGQARAAEQARFLFSVRGVPVGVVALRVDGDDYRYSSEHLFTRGEDRQRLVRSERYAVDSQGRERESGRWLESLWLWRKPASVGCVEGREELGSRRGELCARRIDGEEVRGEVFGEAFIARYRARRLRELRVGAARFVRIDGADQDRKDELRAPPDLFGQGWPIRGSEGGLRIVRPGPPPTRARLPKAAAFASREELDALVRRVHAEVEQEDPQALCTDFVARFVVLAKRPVLVVHGVVAGQGAGRAYPHVWLRTAGPGGSETDVDPTWMVPVTRATHAELAAVPPEDAEQAGRAWLELLSGAATVIRR